MNRRSFVTALSGGVGLAALSRSARSQQKPGVDARIGLQLYSLREYLPKDLAGSLARVRELGIREVEGAGLWGSSAAELRKLIDAAGLRCGATHMGLDRLRDDAAAAFAEAKALGAKDVVCPWIPHEGDFDRDDTMRAAELFNSVGAAAHEQGLRFGYHCHGYEFVESSEGTLFDTLVANTDAERVSFEIDVFWAKAGGADPAAVIAGLPGRVPFLHVKDMEKGLSLPRGSSSAPHEKQVPVGTGQIDWPGVFDAARSAGTEMYYLEDESPQPWEQLPQSLEYLSGIEL